MYDQFIGKSVKLVYKDGRRNRKDYLRYVQGKCVSSDKKSVVIKIEKTKHLFAVSLSEITYIKELRSFTEKEKGIGG